MAKPSAPLLSLAALQELKRRIEQTAADTIDAMPGTKSFDRAVDHIAATCDAQCDAIDTVIQLARAFQFLEESKS